MTTKYIAAAISAVCATGAAIAGVTSIAPVGPNATPRTQPIVFGAPPPRDPAAAAPSVDQIASAPIGLQATGVPVASKGNLTAGCPGPVEARIAASKSQQAVAGGAVPPAFNVTNIAPDAGMGV